MEKKELIYYRLDEVDEKILAMLQDNARVSLKDIGAEVSMSPTAVGTRIDRMLAEGVLEGFTTKLNPEAMGHYIKAFINLEVSPDYSMLIEVRFKTTADLDHFVGELQRFGKTKTQIVFSTNVKHRCRYWKNDLHHDEEKK